MQNNQLKDTCNGAPCCDKVQAEGLQLYQIYAPLQVEFAQICSYLK